MATEDRLIHENGRDPDAVYFRVKGSKGVDAYAIVSACDAERVLVHEWCTFGEATYPYKGNFELLHHFIIGPRPVDVPEDWVVDHMNGNKLDARRWNLRWTTVRFNIWSRHVPNSSSKHRGVSFRRGKWWANALENSLGSFADERSAGEAAAKFYINEFGEWAMTSPVLTDVFTKEELELLREDASNVVIKKKASGLPRGVYHHGENFSATHKGRYSNRLVIMGHP